jgi:predicted Zn-dependent protease
MSPEPTKKGFAARLLQKFGGGPDFKDPRIRREAIANAVDLYQEEFNRTGDGAASRAPLDELAIQFRERDIPTLDIYQQAYSRNKRDTEMLKFLVGEFSSRDPDSKEAVELYWALTVAEPSELNHYFRLVNHYRDSKDPTTLTRIEEQIVERYGQIERGELQPSANPAANLNIFEMALEDLASTYAELGRTDKRAMVVYSRQLEADPQNNELMVMLARCYAEQGRRDEEALRTYEAWFVIDPQDMTLLQALIATYQALGRQEQAVVLMEHVYHQSPEEDQELLGRIVDYYRSRGVVNDANIGYLKRYADVDPRDRQVQRMVANYYAVRENASEEAAGFYERALGEPPSDWSFRLFLARRYMDDDRWDETFDLLDALRGTPLMRGSVLLAYAAAMAKLDRLDAEAAHYYQLAIAAGSRSRSIYTALCRAYIRLKRLDHDAMSAFEETIALDPDNPWAHFGLAAYYIRLDEPQMAYKHAVEHLKRNGADEAGRALAGIALARCLSDRALGALADLPDAIGQEVLLAAARESPQDARILLPLARELYRSGELGIRALEVYEKLLGVYSNDVIARDRAARAARALGENERANAHVRKLAALAKRPELTTQLDEGVTSTRLRSLAMDALSDATDHLIQQKTIARDEEELLKLAMRAGRDDPALYRRLALAAAERNESGAEVLPIYEAALENYPELIHLKHLIMRCYIAMGETAPVFQHARELLEEEPYDKIVLSLLIDCLASTDCYDEETHDLVCFQSRDNAEDHKTLISYALFNYRANRYDEEAAEVLERAIEVAPDDLKVMLLTALARCREVLDQGEAAMLAYERIMGIIPNDLDILKRLSLNYILRGNSAENSREVIQQALIDGPYDLELYLFLAEVFINRRETELTQFLIDRIQQNSPKASDQLVVLLEKAFRLEMSGAPLASQLAEHYYLSGQRDKALSIIDEIPSFTPAQAQQVIELYNIMLVQNGEDLEVRRRRGEMLLKAGDQLSAIEDLVLYWAEEGRKRPLPDNFIELLERFCNDSTYIHPQLVLMMALSLHRAGRHESAIALAWRVLLRDRLDLDANLLVARCRMSLGELELAFRALVRLPRVNEVKDSFYRLVCEFTAAEDYESAALASRAITDHDPDYRDCSRRERELEDLRRGAGEFQRLRVKSHSEALPERARDRFDLVEEIGSSPVSVVYKAYDRELDQLVAIKILSPAFSHQAQSSEVFRNHARYMRRLTHPHLAKIRDIGETPGLDYLSMDYFERGNLQMLIEQGTLALKDKLMFMKQIAQALDALHHHDVVHGGVKPTNILINDLNVSKLSDVGMAEVYRSNPLMSPEIILEDPIYMAPERFHRLPHSLATDIYCYGLVLYETFAGRPPFRSGDLAHQHLVERPAPVLGIPQALNRLIMRCLAKDPDSRYPSMRELVNELNSLLI